MGDAHETERRHCERVAREAQPLPRLHELVPLLVRERAAARAEGLARGRELPRSVDRTELRTLQSKHELLMAACKRAADVLKGHNTSARNQCLAAVDGKTEDELLASKAGPA